jgi:hypothetical protein
MAKRTLKMPLASMNRSLVANNNSCGEGKRKGALISDISMCNNYSLIESLHFVGIGRPFWLVVVVLFVF